MASLPPRVGLKRSAVSSHFCFRAQNRAQRAMPADVWSTGLLLCFLPLCACLGEECVLGVVGRPVLLPCLYPELSGLVNFTLEWRRGDEVVLRSVWIERGNVEMLSANSASIPADAARTGDASLELPEVEAEEVWVNYSLFVLTEGSPGAAPCTVCLQTAASFSPPLLQRDAAPHGPETAFVCHSRGGFPEPTVHWLINNTETPPSAAVTTLKALQPDSNLYNVTSLLTLNISRHANVSCIIENLPMNETLTSTSYGIQSSPVQASRASEAMWIFSTALCVVVGVLVMVGVGYQIHLDRISKRKKKEYQRQFRGYKRKGPYGEEEEEEEEEEVMNPKETDV